MKFRDAVASDIKYIMELERDQDNRDFVFKGTVDEHTREILSDDYDLFIIEEDNERVGFILGFKDPQSKVYELRRIVAEFKGRSIGKRSIERLIDYVFEDLKYNRIWLDTYPDNVRGIKVYESLGFVEEGILRQSYLSERGFEDQIIYSIIRDDYKK